MKSSQQESRFDPHVQVERFNGLRQYIVNTVLTEEEVLLLLQESSDLIDLKAQWFIAVQYNWLQVAEFLLKRGVDPNGYDDNDIPIHLAVYNGQLEMVRVLIRGNADVNRENRFGQSPLHLVAEKGALEIAALLIEQGAELNSLCHGCTPLRLAVEHNQSKLAELLIRHGAKVDLPDDEGVTAFSRAQQLNHFNTEEAWTNTFFSWASLFLKNKVFKVVLDEDVISKTCVEKEINRETAIWKARFNMMLKPSLLENANNTDKKNFLDNFSTYSFWHKTDKEHEENACVANNNNNFQ
ncbi:MAG: ankyrin repeat domain-containing protein [Tatlockia sp.]|jgi:hypothetical protein